MPWDVWQLGMVFMNVLCKTEHAWVRNIDVQLVDGKLCTAHQCEVNMIRIMEEGFGPPSKKEVEELMFYYPPMLNKEKYPNHHKQRQEAYWKKINELEAVSNTSHRSFTEVQQFSQQQVDIYRYRYLMQMNGVSWNRERKTNFHNLAIVDDALRNFVLKLLRYRVVFLRIFFRENVILGQNSNNNNNIIDLKIISGQFRYIFGHFRELSVKLLCTPRRTDPS